MYEHEIKAVLDAYMSIYGLDLSYMRFKVSPRPVYTNGKLCLDKDPDECAGDWTKLGWIRLNSDMPSVMFRYGVDGDVTAFTRAIIAHELAHELWNNVVDEGFKQDILARAKNENFNTIYLKTVRQNKLDEETFCEYIAKMVIGADAGLEFRQVLGVGGELKQILYKMPSYTDNSRLKISQFEKYMANDGALATLWYGCFDKEKCMALAVLKRYHDDDIILLAEIQSVVKGYGKPLIENILRRADNIWWCADPTAGEDLVSYYRQFARLGVKEYLIRRSKWVNGVPEYAFYKAEDSESEKIILDMLDMADMESPRFSSKTL